jgi:hypothetical protein
MKRADRQRIRHLHQLHLRQKKTTLSYESWLTTYFWDPASKEQITRYLDSLMQHHGKISLVASCHPELRERTPIHLPYLYCHEFSFEDGFQQVLFQKLNFTWSFISLFSSVFWSYIAFLSTAFRRRHRQYEKSLGRSLVLVRPNPGVLWENYQVFLHTLGSSWNAQEKKLLGPTWVACSDITAVTFAVPGKNQKVGDTVYVQLMEAVHRKRLSKKQFEALGKSLGRAIQSCYEQKAAFIDISLGNYILDSDDVVRFIDGELLHVYPEEVPSHCRAMELVLFMETMYIETVCDYCEKVNIRDAEAIRRYCRGLLLFFSSFLPEVGLSDDELSLALRMSKEWTPKFGTFFFTLSFSFTHDAKVMSLYRVLLRDSLQKIIEDARSPMKSDVENF